MVVDRACTLVAGNRSIPVLTDGVAAELLALPVNVLRLSLRLDGMAPGIVNLAQWRAHLTPPAGPRGGSHGDPGLGELHRELSALPGGSDPSPPNAIAVPLRIRHADTELAFLSTVTTFGTAVAITAAELSIEASLLAGPHTVQAVRALPDPIHRPRLGAVRHGSARRACLGEGPHLSWPRQHHRLPQPPADTERV